MRKSTLLSTVHSSLQPSMSEDMKRVSFYSLVTEYNFKNENAYFDIILKEKILIILNFFIWMYLLSFLLWIRGVKTINLGESTLTSSLFSQSPATSNAESLVPASSQSQQTSALESVAAAVAVNSLFDVRTSNALLRYPNTSDANLTPNFELSVTSFCITHDFGLFLFNAFALFMAILRLITLIVNLLTSICFHFKFRHEYFNAFQVSFRGIHILVKKMKILRIF